jgi:hypothetical protein
MREYSRSRRWRPHVRRVTEPETHHARGLTRWAPSGSSRSQGQQQVANGSRLGQERVVSGDELDDAARPASELAL